MVIKKNPIFRTLCGLVGVAMVKKIIIYLIEKYALKKNNFVLNKKIKFVKSHFRTNDDEVNCQQKQVILDTQQFIERMIYKDENWNYIRFLSVYRAAMQSGSYILYEDNICDGLDSKYTVDGEGIIIHTHHLMDNWLCFYQDLLELDAYELAFDIVLYSVFTEIQIAFQYQDLGNRYRFMIRNNEEAVFECVYQGEFFHNLWSKPLQLELKKKYQLKLVVNKKEFFFFVNGDCIYSIKEVKPFITGNKLCLIFWNSDDKRSIECKVSNIHINELGV